MEDVQYPCFWCFEIIIDIAYWVCSYAQLRSVYAVMPQYYSRSSHSPYSVCALFY